MRYRKDFRTTYAILSFYGIKLTFDKPRIDQPMRYRNQFDKPKVMITYGCIQEMECNSELSEVLGYPTREMSTPTREMFVNPYVGIVQGYEGNVRLTPTREFGKVILKTRRLTMDQIADLCVVSSKVWEA